ncbi:BPI fold-containing family B member 4-like [Podarcis raffonei]|uniref:BPI fold-containing family B member 4-like n=1 Tax=Podarcis raffonei TaxID=65483 RepID=UPI002329819B|nr:BPI fold-containing family B member 4-like [Podarcis raffonei]
MKTLTVVKTWCLVAIFCRSLVPSQSLGLGGLLGSSSAKTEKGSDSGKGGLLGGLGGGLLGAVGGGAVDGVLGAVGGGGDSKGDGGLLGALGGGGGEGGGGLLGAVGGGDGGGLLGAVGGGDGGGLLGAVAGGDGLLGGGGGLLGNTTGGLLGSGGESGGGGLLGGALGGDLLGKNGLLGGDLLGGENGLLGGNLLGLGGLLGGGGSKEPFQWFNAVNLEVIGGSWKVIRGNELQLNLHATITTNLPGVLSFLSGTSVVMDISPHLALTQDKPGDLKLVLKNCQDMVAGFSIKLPSSLLANLLSGVINSGLRTLLPSVMCPVFQLWFNVVNMQLQALNKYASFGLLGKLQTALSSVPISTGQFSEMDLKDKPFPGAFLNWLLDFARSFGGHKTR